MSLECSECERDLRGGHAPSCSRYRAAIETRIAEILIAYGPDTPSGYRKAAKKIGEVLLDREEDE